MNDRCSNPSCIACQSMPIQISIGVYRRPLFSLPALIVIVLGLALAVGLAVSGCAAPPESAWNCVLCAPSGVLSCADPGVDPCPETKPGDALPVCGVPAGYSVALTDCGGTSINGLRCATGCAWEIGPDTSAEINGHATISFPPGCTLQVESEPGVCVTNCSDCR